jgi:hypothetical protein
VKGNVRIAAAKVNRAMNLEIGFTPPNQFFCQVSPASDVVQISPVAVVTLPF